MGHRSGGTSRRCKIAFSRCAPDPASTMRRKTTAANAVARNFVRAGKPRFASAPDRQQIVGRADRGAQRHEQIQVHECTQGARRRVRPARPRRRRGRPSSAFRSSGYGSAARLRTTCWRTCSGSREPSNAARRGRRNNKTEEHPDQQVSKRRDSSCVLQQRIRAAAAPLQNDDRRLLVAVAVRIVEQRRLHARMRRRRSSAPVLSLCRDRWHRRPRMRCPFDRTWIERNRPGRAARKRLPARKAASFRCTRRTPQPRRPLLGKKRRDGRPAARRVERRSR